MINNSDSLIIYQKYVDLIFYTNDILQKYPKSERFALTQEIKQAMYNGLKCILFAQKEFSKVKRLSYLNHMDVYLNLQKIYIRMSFKYKYINGNNYSTWSLKITEICNMLGAWIKSCLKN